MMTREHVRKKAISVLIFSPDPSLGGGVVEFSRILKLRFGPLIDPTWFLVGRRPTREGAIFRTIMPLIDAARLTALVVHRDFDVYHLNPSFNARSLIRDALFVLILRLFRRRAILVFFRGWDDNTYNLVLTSRLLRSLFARVYGWSERSIVLGTRFAQDLGRLGIEATKISVLTTMFDGDAILSVERRRSDRGVRILFLARFIAAKGVFELLEAFRRLRVDHPHVTLTLAGSGEEESRVRAWCSHRALDDSVTIPGYVSGSEKAQLLVDSDIFALPTYHGEGCPNALLEAMGCGLSVVVTPVGGVPDIICDGQNGLIVPPRDTDALERALRQLVETPGLRESIGRQSRRDAWRCYESRAVTARVEGHYDRLATFPRTIRQPHGRPGSS